MNPVNCEAISGKGLARAFKERWPDAYRQFRHAAQYGRVQVGSVFPVATMDTIDWDQSTYILHFPTKRRWSDDSYLQDIRAGLVSLVQVIRDFTFESVAIPALGCGLGRLNWCDVQPMIEATFASLPDVRVLLYPPQEENTR